MDQQHQQRGGEANYFDVLSVGMMQTKAKMRQLQLARDERAKKMSELD